MLRASKAFVLICFGQAMSILGSGLTSFAVSVWIYEHSKMTTPFALLGLFSFLPGALVLPYAGIITDRRNRRNTMLLCNLAGGTAILLVAFLQSKNLLHVWTLCVVASVMSVATVLLNLTLTASVVALVPPHQLGKANGFKQIGPALARVVSPSLAALIVAGHDVRRLFIIDGISYYVAAALLTLVIIPVVGSNIGKRYPSLKKDIVHGWTYLLRHREIMYLALLLAINECAIQIAYLMLTPLVLRTGSPKQFGAMMSIIAAGVLVGSVLVSLRGLPKNKLLTVVTVNLIEAIVFFTAGMVPRFGVITCAFLAFAIVAPSATSAADTLLQQSIDPAAQGRIFAAVRQLISFSVPIAAMTAGPLVDYVLTPLTTAISNFFGLPGAGNMRHGVTLLFLLLAMVLASMTLWIYLRGKLKAFEAGAPVSTIIGVPVPEAANKTL
jgi:DHA3 family macrolide efflux protein-like MFS transporter